MLRVLSKLRREDHGTPTLEHSTRNSRPLMATQSSISFVASESEPRQDYNSAPEMHVEGVARVAAESGATSKALCDEGFHSKWEAQYSPNIP